MDYSLPLSQGILQAATQQSIKLIHRCTGHALLVAYWVQPSNRLHRGSPIAVSMGRHQVSTTTCCFCYQKKKK